jgi:Tetracyclin repressor-like, C-terminal domain
MDVRPGGTYRFRTAFGVVEGEFREVDAPERLVQTFQNHLQTLEFEESGRPDSQLLGRRGARARDAALVSDRDEPLACRRRARGVSPTRDVVLVDDRVTEGVDDATADAHTEHTGFDARTEPGGYVYLRVTPTEMRAGSPPSPPARGRGRRGGTRRGAPTALARPTRPLEAPQGARRAGTLRHLHRADRRRPEVVKAHVDSLAGQLARIIKAGIARASDPLASARAVFDVTARFHNPAHGPEWSGPDIDGAYGNVRTLVLAALSAKRPRSRK